MTIFEYVAYKNPHGAKDVLNSFGLKANRNPDTLAKQLAEIVRENGKEALFRITSVHPDLQLVTAYNSAITKNIDATDSNKPCDCHKEKESLFSSAEGQEIKKAVENLTQKQDQLSLLPRETKSDSKDLMIIGAVVVVALALVMRK